LCFFYDLFVQVHVLILFIRALKVKADYACVLDNM
jgi:hypothetical protein